VRPRRESSQPAHPAVNWSTLTSGPGHALVCVTCPICCVTMMRPAKEVRWRITHGKLSGLCSRDGQTRVHQMRATEPPSHPAVDWAFREGGRTGSKVRVVCPHCHVARMVETGHVLAQLRGGTFTGRCFRDRLIGKPRSSSPERPVHPAVDWTDTVVVQERNGSRRSKVRVRCPVCETVRLYEPARLIPRILSGVFDPHCRRHRGVAKGAISRQCDDFHEDRPHG